MQPKRSPIRCLDSEVRDPKQSTLFSLLFKFPYTFIYAYIALFIFQQAHLLRIFLQMGILICFLLPRISNQLSLPVQMNLWGTRIIDPILTASTHFFGSFTANISPILFQSEIFPGTVFPCLEAQTFPPVLVIAASLLFFIALVALNRSTGFISKTTQPAEMDFSLLDRPYFWTSITEFSKDLILPDTLSALRILLITCEEQDQYTLGHSIRVMVIAKSIAEAMGLSVQKRKEIAAAALLHDLGKIDIPPAILQKKGKLTEKEMISIRNHPRYTVDILRKYNILEELYPSIQHHHEWFSGHGYPDQIRGDEIPFGARIISAADAVDAMLSVRPYQKPKTVNQAIRELERLKGLQFDPAIAEQAICLLEKHEFTEMIYSQEYL